LRTFQGEEPLDTGAAVFFFSLDASSGLLATRRRLGRWGDSSAMRSAFVWCELYVVCYEEYYTKQKQKQKKSPSRGALCVLPKSVSLLLLTIYKKKISSSSNHQSSSSK